MTMMIMGALALTLFQLWLFPAGLNAANMAVKLV